MPQPTFVPFLADQHAEYLRDESRKGGAADRIAFPTCEVDVQTLVRECGESGIPVTVQGARTGIAGGAVPDGGAVLNLSRMKKVLGLRQDAGRFFVTVEPGIVLSELTGLVSSLDFNTDAWSPETKSALESLRAAGPHFFPPDPTETSALLGGMVACNASGARSFRYGPVRPHVAALRVVLADGALVEIRRGSHHAQGREFSLPTDGGSSVRGRIPSYRWPSVKSAAGYFAQDNMDLIDLFIGSEGTLGVVTSIELALLPLPKVIWGLMAFLPSQEKATRFVRAVRGEAVDGISAGIVDKPAAIEFFNSRALDLLRSQRVTTSAFSEIREIPASFHTGVYLEYHGDSEDAVTNAVMAASEVIAACGGDEDSTWLGDDHRAMRNLKFFRHAIPEAVNLLIDERRRTEPEVTKLGTDMSVPDSRLDDVLAMYDRDLAAKGLDSVIFGHIGNNHLHVNILPRTMDEYRAGKGLYLDWARQVVAWGGSVSGEHGIGKLKREFLALMYGEKGIAEMRAVKKAFDPRGILNRGNLFTWE